MTTHSAILCAYQFDHHGGGVALSGDAVVAHALHEDQLAWVHLQANHPDTRAWLKREVSYLDDLVIDALLAEETQPRMLEIGEGILLIFRGMNFNEGAEPEDMLSIRIWMDPYRIISLERRHVKAVRDLVVNIQAGKAPKTAGDFLVQLSTHLFQHMEPVLLELHDKIDACEQQVLEKPELTIQHDVVDVRKQAIIFRRYLAPQRDVMHHLQFAGLSWLNAFHYRHLQENYDRLQRYMEDLDTLRERAQIVKDELTTILSNRLNNNMYVLSVFAAIFLPLGFLTGLFGMNIGGLPGLDDPKAFWVFTIALIVLVITQIIVFKKLKWF